jgi:cobalt transporter subunit CbtB
MNVRAAETTTSVAISTTAIPALATIVLGVLLLFVVGFAQSPTLHNGAHDTRHANGFPCH